MKGGVHVADLCDLSRADVKDQGAGLQAQALASLGSYGKWANNQERDLHRLVRGLYNLKVEPYKLKLRLWTTQGFQLVDIPCIPPFLLMHAIWTYSEDQFRYTFFRAYTDPRNILGAL